MEVNRSPTGIKPCAWSQYARVCLCLCVGGSALEVARNPLCGWVGVWVWVWVWVGGWVWVWVGGWVWVWVRGCARVRVRARVCACVCVCVRARRACSSAIQRSAIPHVRAILFFLACVRASVRECVRASARVCERACMRCSGVLA